MFAQHVYALTDVFEEMGNPFLEHSDQLLVLDTHDVMDSAAMGGICQAELTGQEQYIAFVEERFVGPTKTIEEPIKKNYHFLADHYQERLPS